MYLNGLFAVNTLLRIYVAMFPLDQVQWIPMEFYGYFVNSPHYDIQSTVTVSILSLGNLLGTIERKCILVEFVYGYYSNRKDRLFDFL